MLLGESIFNSFSASQATHSTVPAVESKLSEADSMLQDLLLGSNSSNIADDFITISPEFTNGSTSLEISASLLNSVFNDELDNNSPMFESAAVDSSSWEPLFKSESPTTVSDYEIKEEDDDAVLTKLLASEETGAPVDTGASVAINSPFSPAELQQRSLSIASVSSKRSFSVMAESSTSFSKKDKLGCTPYTRKKRSAPLEPIVLSDVSCDSSAAKRARNTEAARRSRARKMERMDQLENKCELLIKENNDLKSEIERLKQLLNSS